MAAKKMAAKKTVTVELELEVLKKLVEAADALSELASCSIMGCDDPRAKALGKRKGTGRKSARKKAAP
jgi:hypothetical protein